MPLTEDERRRVSDAAVKAIDQVFAILETRAAASAQGEPSRRSMAPPPINPASRLTTTDACKLLGLSHSALEALVETGRLTATQAGPHRLIRIADLTASWEA